MKVVEVASLTDYVGKELGASDWFQIDQDRINAFADATLDHQFIHVDPDQAKNTPFGTTIAHGYLTLSLLPYLQASIDGFLMPKGMKMAMNYGFDKLRFMAPVKEGKRVRAVATLLEVCWQNSAFRRTVQGNFRVRANLSPPRIRASQCCTVPDNGFAVW